MQAHEAHDGGARGKKKNKNKNNKSGSGDGNGNGKGKGNGKGNGKGKGMGMGIGIGTGAGDGAGKGAGKGKGNGKGKENGKGLESDKATDDPLRMFVELLRADFVGTMEAFQPTYEWFDRMLQALPADRIKFLNDNAGKRHAPLNASYVLGRTLAMVNMIGDYMNRVDMQIERASMLGPPLPPPPASSTGKGRTSTTPRSTTPTTPRSTTPTTPRSTTPTTPRSTTPSTPRSLTPSATTHGGGESVLSGGKRKKNRKNNNNNGKGKGNKNNKNNNNGKDAEDRKVSCRFISSVYDERNPGATYEKLDAAYEWYESFFIALSYDALKELQVTAARAMVPLSVRFVISDLIALYIDLESKRRDLYSERNRMYVLAMKEHGSEFVDSESRGVIKANEDNEETLQKLFVSKRLEYGDHVLLHRFLALSNRMLRAEAADFMFKQTMDQQQVVDPVFRRLDYEPKEGNFFVTYGGTEEVTLKFKISPGFPDVKIPRDGGFMTFPAFENEYAGDTLRIINGSYEDVRDVLFAGKSVSRKSPVPKALQPRFRDRVQQLAAADRPYGDDRAGW